MRYGYAIKNIFAMNEGKTKVPSQLFVTILMGLCKNPSVNQRKLYPATEQRSLISPLNERNDHYLIGLNNQTPFESKLHHNLNFILPAVELAGA